MKIMDFEIDLEKGGPGLIQPSNANTTYVTMRTEVRDGVAVPSSLELSNFDMDPNGEETSGSEAEATEAMHYEKVVNMVRDFLFSEGD